MTNFFNEENTGFNFSDEQIEEMNIQLQCKLTENNIDEDDDTMVKHFAEQVLNSY